MNPQQQHPEEKHIEAQTKPAKPAKPVTLFQVSCALLLLLTVNQFLTWCFAPVPPSADKVAMQILEGKVHGTNLTLAQIMVLASQHPTAPTANEIALAIKAPKTSEIADAVVGKLMEKDGKIDKMNEALGTVYGKIVGSPEAMAQANAIAIFQALSKGVPVNGGTFTIVEQEGGVVIPIIIPKETAPVAETK